MIRIILGILAGFIAWSIIWVGSDQVLISSLDWYRHHQEGFALAMVNNAPFEASTTILIMNLVRSVITSLMAGFIASYVSSLSGRIPIVVGGTLFLLIIFVGFRTAFQSEDSLPVFGGGLLMVFLTVSLAYFSKFLIKDNLRAALVLSILLLLVGVLVEIIAWRYLPIWYHFLFLFLLIPATLAGGKLKRFSN